MELKDKPPLSIRFDPGRLNVEAEKLADVVPGRGEGRSLLLDYVDRVARRLVSGEVCVTRAIYDVLSAPYGSDEEKIIHVFLLGMYIGTHKYVGVLVVEPPPGRN